MTKAAYWLPIKPGQPGQISNLSRRRERRSWDRFEICPEGGKGEAGTADKAGTDLKSVPRAEAEVKR